MIMCETLISNSQLATFLLSLVGGGSINNLSAYVTNTFQWKRDRRARLTQFLSVAGEWRTKTYRSAVPEKFMKDFPEDIARFGGAYIALEPDLSSPKRDNFHRLCDEIISMTDADVAEMVGATPPHLKWRGRDELLKRIEAVIALFDDEKS